jgi:hypothetical protein
MVYNNSMLSKASTTPLWGVSTTTWNTRNVRITKTGSVSLMYPMNTKTLISKK